MLQRELLAAKQLSESLPSYQRQSQSGRSLRTWLNYAPSWLLISAFTVSQPLFGPFWLTSRPLDIRLAGTSAITLDDGRAVLSSAVPCARR